MAYCSSSVITVSGLMRNPDDPVTEMGLNLRPAHCRGSAAVYAVFSATIMQISRTLLRTGTAASTFLVLALVAACGQQTTVEPAAQAAPAVTTPEPVDGWIEYPSTDAITRVHAAKWRTDTVNIPVSGGGGELEYKLNMKKGDMVAYAISYGDLKDPATMVSEFHGHTPQRADGVGDLMYYSKTNGTAQHGQLTAPWDGVHGWYLKNNSDRDVVVKLEVAGFYEIVPDQL